METANGLGLKRFNYDFFIGHSILDAVDIAGMTLGDPEIGPDGTICVWAYSPRSGGAVDMFQDLYDACVRDMLYFYVCEKYFGV